MYRRDVALPAMQRGAEGASRAVPPLVAQVPVCVHENPDEAREYGENVLGSYLSIKNPYLMSASEWSSYFEDWSLMERTPAEETADIVEVKDWIISEGHDGVIIPIDGDQYHGRNYYVIFDPAQARMAPLEPSTQLP